jgi:hypothetical protein
MPLRCYKKTRIGKDRQKVISLVNKLIAEYRAQGLTELTARQVYYQFIARDWFPDDWIDEAYNKSHGLSGNTKNTQKNYKRLCETILIGRLNGLIDWEAISDMTRNLRSLPSWGSPASIVAACATQFRHDAWDDQPYHVEVWIEKDALVGVIEGVCNELRVPHFSCRGYTSASELWSAAQRFIAAGKPGIIFHLGDHDPSGIDMTRDIQDKMDLFGAKVDVRRIGLTREQIDEYEPPPNPCKITDSRATGYIAQHGRDSWELDALDPATLTALVRDNIMPIRNERRWAAVMAREKAARQNLAGVAARWDDVVAFIS